MATRLGPTHTSGSTAKQSSDAPYPGVIASIQAQELLAALVGFIQPIIRAHVPSPANDHVGAQPDNIEGEKLLLALEEFVGAAVRPQKRSQPKLKDDKSGNEPGTTNRKALVSELPKSIPDNDMNWEGVISGNLRDHVFNKMPIRLLAFDYIGSGVKLVEREDVCRLILQKACVGASQPQFRARYEETQKKSYVDPKAFRRDADERNSLITELVEQHATYAILSHTWMRDTPGDVIYKDWATRSNNQRGYTKIAKFCEIAAKNHGVNFGWVDTVCINKDSSSELDESIRSMYKWYRAAHVCVTYLAETRNVEDIWRDPWFTRGWTLQELLAPQDMHFYNMHWVNLLPENDNIPRKGPVVTTADIREQIKAATTITPDEVDLCRCGNMEKIPISRRLQLAAQRKVTREEDAAYSLMGLLGVEISVAYGEGVMRALFRLVRELLSTKKDVLDIFNRNYSVADGKFIATSLTQYLQRSNSFDVPANLTMATLLDKWKPIEPLILTHLGVQVPLLLVPGLLVDPSVVPISVHLERFTPNYPYRTPKGDFSGECSLYDLLERDLYADKLPIRTRLSFAGKHLPTALMFGVLNFTIDNNIILLPANCLSVPLDCGTAKPGNVRPSDSINIGMLPTEQVPVFKLQSTKNKDKTRIPQGELAHHGMQLITLFL